MLDVFEMSSIPLQPPLPSLSAMNSADGDFQMGHTFDPSRIKPRCQFKPTAARKCFRVAVPDKRYCEAHLKEMEEMQLDS